MKRLQAMERAGTLRQAEAQRYLDQDYQDFLRQQDYPYKQLGFYSSMVRGLQPISPYSSQQQQPAPSLRFRFSWIRSVQHVRE